jgi:hypothetical protein
LLSGVGDLNSKYVDDILEEYKEELYQLRYNYKYEAVRTRRIREMLNDETRERKMMEKVDAMTVTDEDIRKAKEGTE